MKRFLLQMAMVIATAFALIATPASAQATRTWISGVGDDANPCSRTAPCKTFAGAISKTASGGEINVLDPGGFGGLTITKPITLRADGALAGVLVASANGIVINLPATGRVVIHGLNLEGLNQTGSPALAGIRLISAATVHVVDTTIRGFTNGIVVDTAGVTDLTVSESQIQGSTASGISLANPAGKARAYVSNSLLANNAGGSLQADGANNTFVITGNSFTGRNSPTAVLTNGAKMLSYGDNAFTDVPSSGYTLLPRN